MCLTAEVAGIDVEVSNTPSDVRLRTSGLTQPKVTKYAGETARRLDSLTQDFLGVFRCHSAQLDRANDNLGPSDAEVVAQLGDVAGGADVVVVCRF